MIFLATDTSGKEGSLALARGDGARLEILEVAALEGGNFSAQLVPHIAALLAKHRLSKRDIGGFAVATGPGSFTGLRVGLAAVKGLAEALGKPVVAVSRLEAVARASATLGSVLAALDAGRRQAYVGEYEVADESASCVKEHLLSWEELAVCAAGRMVATPDKAVAEVLRQAAVRVLETEVTRADAIARIGWKKLAAGEVSDVSALEANYIRRTDAEILVYGK
jgi:tRNA threonylcarbamoyladenosine biosynthesis protein TsaB